MKRQRLTEHPCYKKTMQRLSHRTGGFGGTCERCGTELSDTYGTDGVQTGPVRWLPVQMPPRFQPGSIEEKLDEHFSRTIRNSDDRFAQTVSTLNFLESEGLLRLDEE